MKEKSIQELEDRFTELSKGTKRSSEPKRDNKKITAAELQAQLQQDVGYQKWLQEKEEVRAALEVAYADEVKPLINDLRKVEVNVSSAWDLVNTPRSYKKAIPVLIAHLPRPYHFRNKEGIVRALAVKEAKGIACKAIIEEYHRTPKEHNNFRWVLGNTMTVIITEEYVDDVNNIVLDATNGESRQMFVVALGKLESPKTKEVLRQLLSDKSEVIKKEAQKALKRFK